MQRDALAERLADLKDRFERARFSVPPVCTGFWDDLAWYTHAGLITPREREAIRSGTWTERDLASGKYSAH